MEYKQRSGTRHDGLESRDLTGDINKNLKIVKRVLSDVVRSNDLEDAKIVEKVVMRSLTNDL